MSTGGFAALGGGTDDVVVPLVSFDDPELLHAEAVTSKAAEQSALTTIRWRVNRDFVDIVSPVRRRRTIERTSVVRVAVADLMSAATTRGWRGTNPGCSWIGPTQGLSSPSPVRCQMRGGYAPRRRGWGSWMVRFLVTG